MYNADAVNLFAFRMQVPVDLVVDHSVQVDVSRSADALQANMEHEFGRNKERFAFLKWGATAFKNMLVVPPGSGIVHQVSPSESYELFMPTFSTSFSFVCLFVLIMTLWIF